MWELTRSAEQEVLMTQLAEVDVNEGREVAHCCEGRVEHIPVPPLQVPKLKGMPVRLGVYYIVRRFQPVRVVVTDDYIFSAARTTRLTHEIKRLGNGEYLCLPLKPDLSPAD